MHALSFVNNEVDNFLNTINPNERILSNRTIKIAIPATIGGIAFGVFAYNNSDFLITTTKILWNRIIGTTLSLSAAIFQIFETTLIKLRIYDKIQNITTFITTLTAIFWYTWTMSIASICIQMFGTADFLPAIISKEAILWAHDNIAKENRVSNIFSSLFIAFALPFGVVRLIKELTSYALIVLKTCVSNNRWSTFKFLLGCRFFTKLNIIWDAIKLPHNIIDKINTSDPWEAFVTLSQNLPKLSQDPVTQIRLAGCPKEIKNLLIDYTVPNYALKNSDLLKVDNARQEPIIKVLYYLGKFPELYQGDNKLPGESLQKILSLKDPRPILELLCTNTYLWQGNNKLTSNVLHQLIMHPQCELIHPKLREWSLLFKDFCKLQENDIVAIMHSANSLNTFWPKFIFDKITSTYQEKQLVSFQSGCQNTFLNIKKFFNDWDMDKWNMLARRPGNISSNDWNTIQNATLPTILRKTYPQELNKISNLRGFCSKCLNARDAITPIGKQSIMHQVVSVVDFLASLTVSLDSNNLTDIEKELLTTKIKAIVDIIEIPTNVCPDGAIVALNLAENLIKIFQEPEYIGNVIVNMFKLNSIEATLINQNQGENVESYLYFIIKLNDYLGLGLSISRMLYEQCAQKQPLGQAMSKLIAAFTEENLIGYTANLNVLKILFGNEAASKCQIKECKQLMEDVYGIEDMEIEKKKQLIVRIKDLEIELEEAKINTIYNNPDFELSAFLMRQLDTSRVRLEYNFYAEKAKQILIKSGFLHTRN